MLFKKILDCKHHTLLLKAFLPLIVWWGSNSSNGSGKSSLRPFIIIVVNGKFSRSTFQELSRVFRSFFSCWSLFSIVALSSKRSARCLSKASFWSIDFYIDLRNFYGNFYSLDHAFLFIFHAFYPAIVDFQWVWFYPLDSYFLACFTHLYLLK